MKGRTDLDRDKAATNVTNKIIGKHFNRDFTVKEMHRIWFHRYYFIDFHDTCEAILHFYSIKEVYNPQ